MDPDLIVDEALKQKLLNGGMDDLLATHFAHLFIRDPIVIFSEDLKVLDPEGSNHFENIQSTNWQHMRFKPPPPDADIGWRVEFRSMEIQMTDFENAAFSIFIVLVTRAILSFDLNFYIPIPRTTENMETAHTRNGVMESKFWFRKDPFPRRSPKQSPSLNGLGGDATSGFGHSVSATSRPTTPGPVDTEYGLMTIDEIINGASHGSDSNAEGFPGLIPLVESYLDSVNIDVSTRCELARYLDLIRQRANGTLWTGAKWIREFVRKHEDYNSDSEVGQKIVYDLFKAVEEVGKCEGRPAGKGTGWEMFTAKERQKGRDD
jgi:glutamate--cysteine ligase catalytic subunit